MLASFWQLRDRLRRGAVPVQRSGVVGAAARRAGEDEEYHYHSVRSSARLPLTAGAPGRLLPQVALPNTHRKRAAQGSRRCFHRGLMVKNVSCSSAGGNCRVILAALLLFSNLIYE